MTLYNYCRNIFNPAPFKAGSALLLIAIVLASCSGDQPTGGVTGTGRTSPDVDTGLIIGRIDSLSDLMIDGVSLAAARPTVLVNGEQTTLDTLRVGMPVTATVNYDESIVQTIEYKPLLSGPITTSSDDKKQLEILGQSVEITTDTYLDELTVEDIFISNIIEVNGDRDNIGVIIADYIRVPDLSNDYFVVGELETPDQPDGEARVAGTPVEFSPPSIENPTDNAELKTGDTVKIEIDSDAEITPQAPLKATTTDVLPDVSVSTLELVVINGVVAKLYESGEFEIKKLLFRTDENTQFTDRSGNIIDPVTIQQRDVLRVTGAAIADNLILAHKVRIRK